MTTKLSTISELRDAVNSTPDYSMAEIIYAVLRPQGDKTQTGKLSDILKLSDQEILTRAENFKKLEHE